MTKYSGGWLWKLRPSFALSIAIVLAPMATVAAQTRPAPGLDRAESIAGYVESNGVGLRNYRVQLFVALAGKVSDDWQLLGSGVTDTKGHFEIIYPVRNLPSSLPQSPLFVEAVSGRVMLASAIGNVAEAPTSVVINERTTVATGNAFAQFIKSASIEGNAYGMSNATHMAANLANPVTGEVGVVLGSKPNGTETTTLATFNSLANAVASCVAVSSECAKLLAAGTAPGALPPSNVLQALANIVKNPAYLLPDGTPAIVDPLFNLSEQREIYSPFLTARPTNWLLFLKITGGFYSVKDSNNLMNGPANFGIDKQGTVWVGNNYIPEPDNKYACAGNRLNRFTPWGSIFPGAPYSGGGLSGAGYGITFDLNDNLWTANFGFQDPPCVSTHEAAPSDSASLFTPSGVAVSPSSGYAVGGISWPQGVVSDRKGNIFVANCGNDSVTKIPKGNINLAFNIKMEGASTNPDEPAVKPFGIAIDLNGNAWITDNFNNTVSIVSGDGKLIATLPGTYHNTTVLTHPVGNTVDSKGNIWVANSDWLDVPCPSSPNVGQGKNPSITLYEENARTPYKGSPFTGGGLTVPWGIAVDGDDTVWVFNFGSIPVDPVACKRQGVNKYGCAPTGISRFCGTRTDVCPAGLQSIGAPISPKDTGYQSDSLERITGGQIDPSGNIWMTGNWQIDASPSMNPGGNSVEIAIGAATPLQTPLIGPPVPFD